jgi:hypothetical protein
MKFGHQVNLNKTRNFVLNDCDENVLLRNVLEIWLREFPATKIKDATEISDSMSMYPY